MITTPELISNLTNMFHARFVEGPKLCAEVQIHPDHFSFYDASPILIGAIAEVGALVEKQIHLNLILSSERDFFINMDPLDENSSLTVVDHLLAAVSRILAESSPDLNAIVDA